MTDSLAATPLGEWYRGRTVLVSGYSGLLGRWATALLGACGAQVVGLARGAGLARDMHDVVVADVADAVAVRAAIDASAPDVVLHLAAQSQVRAARRRATWTTNVLGTVNVLDAAVELGVPACVVVGSSRDPSREHTDAAFHDAYNASKLAVEHVVAGYREDALAVGRGVALARPAVLVGGGDRAPGRLVPTLLDALAGGEPLTVASPGAFRPWQHAVESAAGLLQLGARLADDPAGTAVAYDFGLPATFPTSVGALTRALTRAWTGEPADGVDPPPTEGFWLGDERARAELGWWSCWSLRETLEAAVEWHRAAAEGPAAVAAVEAEQVTRYAAAAAAAGVAWAVTRRPNRQPWRSIQS